MKVITLDEQKLIHNMVALLGKYCDFRNPCIECTFRKQCDSIVGIGSNIELEEHHFVEIVTSYLKEISV